MEITRSAPSIQALWIAIWPTGPAPQTATVSPFSIPAFTARDDEWNDDTVTTRQASHVSAHPFNDAHRFVAEDVTFFHSGLKAIQQMKIRAADGGRRHTNDHICWSLQHGIGNGVHPNVIDVVSDQGPHRLLPPNPFFSPSAAKATASLAVGSTEPCPKNSCATSS